MREESGFIFILKQGRFFLAYSCVLFVGLDSVLHLFSGILMLVLGIPIPTKLSVVFAFRCYTVQRFTCG